MAPNVDQRVAVDRLLAADKTLAGRGEWTVDREGEFRSTRALVCVGEISPAELVIKSYPRRTQPAFRLVLTMSRAIWRVDYIMTEIHSNPHLAHRRDADPQFGLVKGPHFHSWADNRQFGSARSLPRELHIARPMPDRIRSFEQAFRWFCAETNIDLGYGDVPDLPRRDTLL